MKTLRICSFLTLYLAIAGICFAQQKTEKMIVSGECGMCKKKIEKAAKDGGATYAFWNQDTKVLTVRYSSTSANPAKIEKKIAAVGYDTPDFRATDEAYNKLDECCQYEREGENKGVVAANQEKSCCDQKGVATAGKSDCCQKKDGKSAMNCSDDKSSNKKVKQ